MAVYTFACAQCGNDFRAATDAAVTCSVSCRNRRYRDALRAQRTRLALEAEKALSSGDINALEVVARRTVALLSA